MGVVAEPREQRDVVLEPAQAVSDVERGAAGVLGAGVLTGAVHDVDEGLADDDGRAGGGRSRHQRGPVKSTAEYACSLDNRCSLSTLRMVPDLLRMTMLDVEIVSPR